MSRPRHRIVHVVGTLGGGGVQRLLLTAAASPELSGVSHSVICLEGLRGQLVQRYRDAGIEARACPFLWPSPVPIGPYRASKWLRQQLAWTFKRRLAREIKALGATIVHSHITSRIDEQAEAAIRIARVPWVWTIHGLYRPEGAELDRWKRAAKLLDEGRGRVTAVSEAIVSDLEARGVRPREAALVIHGGVDLRAFSVRPASRDLRALLKIPADVVVIGTVGRLVREKAYDVLLAAAETLVRRQVQFRVLIAGEGKLRGVLQSEIKSRRLEGCVKLLGFQSDIRGFLSNLDVYVQPSRSEGFGIALVEALAAGLPCVATSIGGMPAILAGETGVLVPPEDAGSLAEALERLASPSMRSAVARNAVEVARRHSIDVTARRWAEVYDGLGEGDVGAGRQERRRYRRGLDRMPRRVGDLVRRVEWGGQHHANWRCAEPVLVFESDDWGLERRASSEHLKAYGEPGERADEETETAEDLLRLFDVLERHRDSTGRPAAFSANFVAANPDHDAIARDRYEVYHEIPIDAREDLRSVYREGMARGVFCAELHGRRHFSIDDWLADLRQDVPGARQLSAEHRHGGLSLLRGQGQRYHTEYLSWRSGVEPDEETIAREMNTSLDVLERLFGRRPLSTIAPHYVFSTRTERAWRRAGLRFIQGANFHVMRADNAAYGESWVSHAMGEISPGGLRYLRRSVKFEPRPERSHHGIAAALPRIQSCFEQRIPAVVDSHRINYTGRYRDGGLRALDDLLSAVTPLKPLFLTTTELGEAMERGGPYRDVFTGTEKFLTVLDPGWRRAVRAGVGWWNARLAAVGGG